MDKSYILKQFGQIKSLQAAQDYIYEEIAAKCNLEEESMTKDYLFDYLYNEETPTQLLFFMRKHNFIED